MCWSGKETTRESKLLLDSLWLTDANVYFHFLIIFLIRYLIFKMVKTVDMCSQMSRFVLKPKFLSLQTERTKERPDNIHI